MEDNSEERSEESVATPLLYTVEDKPTWLLSLLLGIQHYLTTIGGIISVPFILAPKLCIVETDPARGYLISTIFMVSGISTLLQCTLGVRLPIIQGSSFAFISCILTYLLRPERACPSTGELFAMGEANRTNEWQIRMTEIQGAVICVALMETVLGYSGLVAIFARFISPITIAATIALVGISMVEVALNMAAENWYLSMATILLLIIFSQFLRSFRTPVIWYSKGWTVSWIHSFQLFSVLLTTVIVWSGYILTTSVFWRENNNGWTESQMETLQTADWFRIPYPFQWGWPRFTTSSILAMMAALFVSILESIGDYYACSRICGKPPPPLTAVSRGIGVEGLGCLVAGVFGIGPGVTSFSENIGAIGVTKVGSIRVIICGAIFMIYLSLFGKVGAVFALIPTSIVGGLLCVMFSMVTAVGLSNLQCVDLKSHRNMFVLGTSIFFGIAFPEWLQKNNGIIQTGCVTLDQLMMVLLSTKIFVGAALALVLDNAIPGTRKERGFLPWQHQGEEFPANDSIYDLPPVAGGKFFKKTGLYIAMHTCGR